MTDESRDPAASLGSVDERELPYGEGFMCEGLSDRHLARLQKERRDAGFGYDEII